MEMGQLLFFIAVSCYRIRKIFETSYPVCFLLPAFLALYVKQVRAGCCYRVLVSLFPR